MTAQTTPVDAKPSVCMLMDDVRRGCTLSLDETRRLVAEIERLRAIEQVAVLIASPPFCSGAKDVTVPAKDMRTLRDALGGF